MHDYLMKIRSDFKTASVCFRLYFVSVRSHLEYVAVIWNPELELRCSYVYTESSLSKRSFRAFYVKSLVTTMSSNFLPYDFKCSMFKNKQLSGKKKRKTLELFLYLMFTNPSRTDSSKIVSLLATN